MTLYSIINIIKHKYVKEIYFCVIFLAEKFVLSMNIRIFSAREPAKPLNDAQMCGSFFYRPMAARIPFVKTYSTPQELVRLLKTRGMDITDGGKSSALSFSHRLLSFVCLYVPITFYSQGTASIQVRRNFQQSHDAVSL